ncbi:hypothetical protein [Bradyrhizobium lablabi]|uniref:hypothetical protein n=1 Tax=Bradyrhizobium lablabi TaxID=722472 RepID=UPI001BAC1790|nr:hypothetical protein [Bradyrhizobium lablabi]MBR0692731.1 hypothetical protein [Bradyrhizobium lablabi]
MPSVFPSTALRRAAPQLPPARSRVSPQTLQATRVAVHDLLRQTQAFNALPENKRRELANGLVQIGTYLAEPDGMRLKRQSPQVRALAGDDPPKFGTAIATGVEQAKAFIEGVNFPEFVSGLIQGVFHSIVQSSIEQMEAYAKLVADVSKSLNQFRDDNTTDNQGRDHLVDQFPDLFELSMAGGDDAFGDFGGDDNAPPQPKVTLRDGIDEKSAIDRLNRSLPLDRPLTGLDDELVEALLVPAARTQIATGRQQLLATMVMLGINRIVVTDGKISAKVVFDFKASDSRKYARSATRFDHEKDASGNLQMTSTYSGDYEGKSEGGSYSKSSDSEERRDGSYYSKGNYRYSQQPVLNMMSTSKLMDDSQLSAKAQLVGAVEVNFKSDFLPLEKMANPENIAAIQMNAQPGMVKTMAGRPQTATPASAAPAPAATAPAPATATPATPAPAAR